MNIPVAFPVPNSNSILVDTIPQRLLSGNHDAQAIFQEILGQKEIYENACKQFKDLLGIEDFQDLSNSPFWHQPKSDEFRDRFLSSRRPILRTLAVERLKLWDLLLKYHNEISATDLTLKGLLSSQELSYGATLPGGVMGYSVESARSSQQFLISLAIVRFPVTYFSAAFSGHISEFSYYAGVPLKLILSTDHIVENDEAIRLARVKRFEYDRMLEFIDFLKLLDRTDQDSENYSPPPVYFHPRNRYVQTHPQMSVQVRAQLAEYSFYKSDNFVFERDNLDFYLLSCNEEGARVGSDEKIPEFFDGIMKFMHCIQVRGWNVQVNSVLQVTNSLYGQNDRTEKFQLLIWK
jgi:hypothetical protein